MLPPDPRRSSDSTPERSWIGALALRTYPLVLLWDLLGSYGSNSWTVSADNSLATSDPTLAANFDTSVDNFDSSGIPPAFENIVEQFDPSAFSVELTGPDQYGYFPVNAVGDLATGLDYTLVASGLESTVDPALLKTFEWGEAILLSPLLFLAAFLG